MQKSVAPFDDMNDAQDSRTQGTAQAAPAQQPQQ